MQIESKFSLGQIVATPNALEALGEDATTRARNLAMILKRHAKCDWGEVCPDDWAENDLSLQKGFRILSAYTINGVKVWIITEADRSSTCVLLPEDY